MLDCLFQTKNKFTRSPCVKRAEIVAIAKGVSKHNHELVRAIPGLVLHQIQNVFSLLDHFLYVALISKVCKKKNISITYSILLHLIVQQFKIMD